MLFGTEGATDAKTYAEIVGRHPEDVAQLMESPHMSAGLETHIVDAGSLRATQDHFHNAGIRLPRISELAEPSMLDGIWQASIRTRQIPGTCFGFTGSMPPTAPHGPPFLSTLCCRRN